MSSRLVISMVCVGAVAFACGPRTRSESATQSATITLAATSASVTQQADARTTDGSLSATLYVRSGESPMRLALHVVNTSKKRLELTFPNGQTHDFVILDSVGREVWRWGQGRMFTQSLRNKLLGAGEALELEGGVGTLTLAPGKYVARATLTSQNYPIVEEAAFIVQDATFAAR